MEIKKRKHKAIEKLPYNGIPREKEDQERRGAGRHKKNWHDLTSHGKRQGGSLLIGTNGKHSWMRYTPVGVDGIKEIINYCTEYCMKGMPNSIHLNVDFFINLVFSKMFYWIFSPKIS